MPNYENAKIYKLENEAMPNLVYYGSTCGELKERFRKHKNPSNKCSSKKLFEFGNPQIILIENFPCSNKTELEQRERFYIENNECINIMIPTRTQKEYYQDNKEKFIEYRKQYYKDNKDKLNKLHNQYNKDNKEKISEQQIQYKEKKREKQNKKNNCECGGKFTHVHRSRHSKSKKHMKYIESL